MEENIIRSRSESTDEDFRLYKYRWFILLLFCLYSWINFVQFLQYTIITNIIAKYYDIETFTVSWTTLVFMVCFIVLCFPASYIMERLDLRQVSILASGLTACGVGIRLFSISRDRYYIVLIGQTLSAIAQVFILSLTSKLAAVWFGKKEVSTACAIAILGTQLGVACGSVISPNVVKNHPISDVDLIGEELFQMILYNSIVAYVFCFLVVLFFESKPPTPPSYAQLNVTDVTIDHWKSLKNLMTNKDYVVLLFAIGISTGIFNAFGIELNTMYLHYFPGGEADAGLVALITIISGGCIGSLVFGYILDKTHRFKLTTFTILFMSSVTFVVAAIVMDHQLRIGTFIAVGFYGFFLAGSLLVGFEYSAEVTYPEPEATALAFLNGVVFGFSLIFSVIVEACFNSIGFFWTNIGIGVFYFLCSLLILLISPNLRRLQMNQSQNDGVTALVS